MQFPRGSIVDQVDIITLAHLFPIFFAGVSNGFFPVTVLQGFLAVFHPLRVQVADGNNLRAIDLRQTFHCSRTTSETDNADADSF